MSSIFSIRIPYRHLATNRNGFGASFLAMLLAGFVLFTATSVFGQQDPYDMGGPDSVYLVINDYEIGPDDSGAVVDLYIHNDVQELISVAVGMHWDNPQVRIDSVVPSQIVLDVFDFLYFYDADQETSNDSQRVSFVGISIGLPGLPPTNESHLLASFYFSDDTWGYGDSCCIDTNAWSFGFDLKLADESGNQYAPAWGGEACAWAVGFPQDCFGTLGSVQLVPECDSTDQFVDITDLQLLIDHEFFSLKELCWWKEADLDFSGYIDITDLQLMVDHEFISLQPFPECK